MKAVLSGKFVELSTFIKNNNSEISYYRLNSTHESSRTKRSKHPEWVEGRNNQTQGLNH